MTPIPSALLDGLRASRRVLAISHVKPDGDAVGSLLGIGLILQMLGKQVTLTLQDAPPAEFGALPGASAIVAPAEVGAGFDTIVVVDASSADRMGSAWRSDYAPLPLLVIDHHVTNTRFGTVNWVAPDHAATCQMLVGLADALQLAITPELAHCLLAGLVTDTLCFRTSNTTAAVLETGMRLIERGGKLADITENLLEQRPFSVLRLWGDVLDDVRLEEGVIWTTVSRAALAAAGDRDNEDGSLSSLLIRTVGADISASFLEKVDDSGAPQVECSFRARRGFDISATALALGGGGHRAAGGCTIPGTLAEAVARVVPMLKAVRAQQAGQIAARAAEPAGAPAHSAA